MKNKLFILLSLALSIVTIRIEAGDLSVEKAHLQHAFERNAELAPVVIAILKRSMDALAKEFVETMVNNNVERGQDGEWFIGSTIGGDNLKHTYELRGDQPEPKQPEQVQAEQVQAEQVEKKLNDLAGQIEGRDYEKLIKYVRTISPKTSTKAAVAKASSALKQKIAAAKQGLKKIPAPKKPSNPFEIARRKITERIIKQQMKKRRKAAKDLLESFQQGDPLAPKKAADALEFAKGDFTKMMNNPALRRQVLPIAEEMAAEGFESMSAEGINKILDQGLKQFDLGKLFVA